MKYSTTASFGDEDAEDHLNDNSDAGGTVTQRIHGTIKPTSRIRLPLTSMRNAWGRRYPKNH